jgi:GAF domain-containing protein
LLHATLDPAMVQKVIGEIVINLLGSERFALLLRQEAVSTCELAFSEGLTAEDRAFFGPDGYCGGDTLIDEALAEGRVVVGQTEGSRAIAAAPLRMQDQTIGVLVILELLGHKKELTGDDCELLELLASHAASAWVLAQLHASAHRKLKTLEELVRLVPRPAPGAQAGLDPLDIRPSGGHEPRR